MTCLFPAVSGDALQLMVELLRVFVVGKLRASSREMDIPCFIFRGYHQP